MLWTRNQKKVMVESKQRIVEIPTRLARLYLVKGEESSVLVDTGFPGNGKRILKFLIKKGIDPQKIALILITHGHIDHYGSARELRELTGAPIAIHELDAEGPRKGIPAHLYPRGFLGRAINFYSSRQRVEPFDPDIILQGDEDLGEYGVEGRVVLTPGHTPGSISAVVPEAAIIGDLIVGKFFFSKAPAYSSFIMDGEQLRQSVRRLLEYSPKVFLACHGGPFEPQAVAKKFLRDTLF